MNVDDRLRQIIQHFADQQRIAIRELKPDDPDRTDKFKEATSCLNRCNIYVSRRDREYQCPHCWAKSGMRGSLHSIGGGTLDEDFFRCNVCHEVVVVPAR